MPKKSNKDNSEDLQQQVGELTADMQRIQADFVNFKRRAEEDQQRAVAVGRESTIKALLPTIDNIERALAHVPDDLKDHDYAKAVQSVAKKLQSDLHAMGLVKITALGEEFNPEIMEAVSMEDGDGDKEVVIEELQSGYMLHDEVLRHAMVKVGKE